MVLPLEADLLIYALVATGLGLCVVAVLIVALILESLSTKLRLAEWFDTRD